jgi:hypothetical protein
MTSGMTRFQFAAKVLLAISSAASIRPSVLAAHAPAATVQDSMLAAQDSLLARIGDRTIRLADYERALHSDPDTLDFTTYDGRRALLFELVNKEILELSALDRYPETPPRLARAMKTYREFERRRAAQEALDPDSTRPKAILDSLWAAMGVKFHDEGLQLLRSLYVWTPITGEPLEFLDANRARPLPTPEESRVLAIEFERAESWTVADVVDRMMELPTGVWPRGDSIEQVVGVLNMLIRDFLFDVAAANLGVESAPEYVDRVQRRDLDMRVRFFYRHDVIGKLEPPTPGEARAYFEENRERYVAPEEYLVESLTSSSSAVLEHLRDEWRSGVDAVAIVEDDSGLDTLVQREGAHTLKKGERHDLDVVLSALEPGDASPVVNDDRGFHVYRLLMKTPARTLAYEEVQDTVAKEWIAARENERLSSFLSEKRRELGVVIEENRLRTLRWPPAAESAIGR